jgi:two-component system NtrC family sensor kinase
VSRLSLRTKLILSFSAVIVVAVFLAVFVGIRFIGDTVIRQTQDKVRLDLNSAREVYQQESGKIRDVIRLTAIRFFLKDAMARDDRDLLSRELQKIRQEENLDILNLVDSQGRVVVRASHPDVYGDHIADDAVVAWALSRGEMAVSTELIPRERLEKDGDGLARKAAMVLVPTPKARPRSETEETSGMMIEAAAPILGYDGTLIGVLYGGKLLNRNYQIVDKVKDIVYRGERYQEKDVGTVTIFQGDLRVATNVMRSDGTRAIGTRVSQEVYDQVIGRGQPWIGRAFVVNDWYITAYETIKDINGDIIGMLYVGMLEAPYTDMKNRVVLTFLGIALLCVVLLTVIAFITTTNIVNPLRELLFATQRVAHGDLDHRLQITSQDEIGRLGRSFNRMTEELHKATESYRALLSTLEDKVREKTEELRQAQDQLVQSEKLTSLGKFAAGIAHEVNNPLTSILINSHLVAERLERDDGLQEHLQMIIDETTRCGTIVKGLLDFSRQTPPQKSAADINNVVEKTLLLLKSQIIMQKVEVETKLEGDLPRLQIDVNQMQQVFANLILNALDAMPRGGRLSFRTRKMAAGEQVEVSITDTGRGIPKEHLGRIFDPFFTTKGMAGTGLGLSVSYGIVRRHGGTIEARSAAGKGTTMIIRLPVEGPANTIAERGD